ncbi:hypothetical protein [Edaphobacter modestus]|uniref:Uncharacterized protein n=1 Tax=Edaphobacter modestus TaxID=388466 RepID=A0A4Q7Z1A8_9BACT|nr:hypothetical protein [Edaphobacter modestus]RZU43654.1 hypothetical protein BDD14_5341 [Edaphobacter modestus]
MGITRTSSGLSSKNAEIEARRSLVRRVVESSTFAKSERLSSFLICICDLTLSGRASEINEQKIGTTVFGRAPDYDSSIDGIVRPQASRLRQRLDLYFNGEGVNEPVRITLPRGSYVPVFEPNPGQSPAVDPPSVPAVIPSVSSPSETSATLPWSLRSARLPWILVMVLLAALLVVGVRSAKRFAANTSTSSTPNPLWSVLFRPNQRTIVVPSDTGLVMWQSATRQSIDLEGYLSGSYRAQSTGDIPTGQLDPADIASRRYTSIVDLGIVKQLTQIADAQKNKLALSYARDVRVDDLKEANVVLIGAAVANPWVELFEPKMNFVFADAHIRQYTVVNRAPTGTEPVRWTANYDDVQHRVYGVVGFLPNLGGTGSVLILEGTSMAGTQCAWDFVADDSSFLPFVNHIRRPDGSIPYFQLVLESKNLTGSAVKRSILAWRVMD